MKKPSFRKLAAIVAGPAVVVVMAATAASASTPAHHAALPIPTSQHPAIASGGTGIYQYSTAGCWRIELSGSTPGILELDDQQPTCQGFNYYTHSADSLIEIELGPNGGGRFQGECVTWNAGLLEYDIKACQWLVSQEFNLIPIDESNAETALQSWYNKGCAWSNGEEAEISTGDCGSPHVTDWYWEDLCNKGWCDVATQAAVTHLPGRHDYHLAA